MGKNCLVKVKKGEWEKAEFIGVFQFSNVIDASPLVGGHPGGVIAFPVVVVKMNGEIKEVRPPSVKFYE
ncbi:hypothetical protein [Sutcliffiella sp. FSL R7-0096]|uniref:hypothetical protein n=1 Tax=Sutcliffiella sp. FSL R7-0096 TaxID=2921670 RepID=UPI00315B3B74